MHEAGTIGRADTARGAHYCQLPLMIDFRPDYERDAVVTVKHKATRVILQALCPPECGVFTALTENWHWQTPPGYATLVGRFHLMPQWDRGILVS